MTEPAWAVACEAVADCDCLLSLGALDAVYPAAMLPEQAETRGAKLIAIGPQPAPAHVWLSGTAAGLLPTLVETV